MHNEPVPLQDVANYFTRLPTHYVLLSAPTYLDDDSKPLKNPCVIPITALLQI